MGAEDNHLSLHGRVASSTARSRSDWYGKVDGEDRANADNLHDGRRGADPCH